jgi:hypothetical protein
MGSALNKTVLLVIVSLIVLRGVHAADGQDETFVLRKTLEKVYARYLASVEKKDAKLLLSVLPTARIMDLRRTFESNGMKFPDDYFTAMGKYAPKMPPADKFRFIGATDSAAYANLIYVGNMNGYLRHNADESRFLIVQFEKENNDWKYAVVIDPPISLVPDLEVKLATGDLGFLTTSPFAAEKIQLRP